jgi:group I intron endonuclease
MIVYRATNKINGKCYIGYTTKSIDERIKEHIYRSKSKNDKSYFYLFKKSLRKYGIDSFKWDVLENCESKQDCCLKEIYYIKKYNTISPNGYNLTEGGNGGVQSEQTKLKISNTVKEYWKNNKNSHHWKNSSSEDRSEWAKKSWLIKKENGYIKPSYFHSEESKLKISITKNNKNRIKWFNNLTNEVLELSITEMANKTKLSVGTFSHLYKKRTKITKCGWRLFEQ